MSNLAAMLLHKPPAHGAGFEFINGECTFWSDTGYDVASGQPPKVELPRGIRAGTFMLVMALFHHGQPLTGAYLPGGHQSWNHLTAGMADSRYIHMWAKTADGTEGGQNVSVVGYVDETINIVYLMSGVKGVRDLHIDTTHTVCRPSVDAMPGDIVILVARIDRHAPGGLFFIKHPQNLRIDMKNFHNPFRCYDEILGPGAGPTVEYEVEGWNGGTRGRMHEGLGLISLHP